MNASREKIYNYSHLFVVTLVFSAFATEILVLYLLVRESFWMPFEPMIVITILCTFFSVLGQGLSKVKEIGRWIFFVSVFSSASYYEIFIAPTTLTQITDEILLYGTLSFYFGWLAYWELLDYGWTYLNQRKIAKKPIAIILGSGILAILAFSLASVYSTKIISFFDSHPWAMTLIGIVVTLLGGIFIGRRTKKS